MTSAEFVSLLRFANGNVDSVSEILKSLDIKEPFAGPKKQKIERNNEIKLNDENDPIHDDKRELEIFLKIYDIKDPQEVSEFKFKPTDFFPTLPSQIEYFTNLKVLDCSSSKLTFLPWEIGQLSQLQVLDCNDNELTSLPPEIGQLSQLQNLKCRNNQLTRLPPEIGQLSQLRVLDCSGNELTSLPREIGQLSQLEYLNCQYNKIVYIPEEIARLKNLKIVLNNSPKTPFFGSEEGKLVMEETLTEAEYQENVFDFMNEVSLEFFVLSLRGSNMFLIHFDKRATKEKSDYFEKIVNFIAIGEQFGLTFTSVESYMERKNDPHLLVLISLQKEVVLLNGFLLGTFSEKDMQPYEIKRYEDLNFPSEEIATIITLNAVKPPVNFSEYFFSNRGVYYFGTMLVRIFESMAFKAKKSILALEALRGAMKFYEKLGFIKILEQSDRSAVFYYKETAVPLDSEAPSWHRVLEKRKEMEKALVLSQGNVMAAAQLVWYRLY